MKKTRKCPKCGSKTLHHAETVLDRSMLNAPTDMALGTKEEFWKGRYGGELEAYACKECGFTEFYVKDVENLV
jgi:predicted nucleic-acid-binding Zn-ribbon protein